MKNSKSSEGLMKNNNNGGSNSSNVDEGHKKGKRPDKDLILSVEKVGGKMGKVGMKGATQAVGFFQDFLEFINKGNVIDLAVGVVIGSAFTTIVNSLVNDIMSPLIGLATSGVTLTEKFVVLQFSGNNTDHHSYQTREIAKKDGSVTLDYGNFIQNIINFIIVGFCVFLMVKVIGSVWRKEKTKTTDWPCPYCKSLNKEGATHCSHCCAYPIYPEDDGNEFACPYCTGYNKIGATRCIHCCADPIYPEDISDKDAYLKKRM